MTKGSSAMKKLEIIELCSLNADPGLLLNHLTALFDQIAARNTPCSVQVYRNGFVDTNFSIHLSCESLDSREFRSAMGEHIADVLKELGIVNHTVWIQQR